eukprot:TRINITY_DN12022_c1_g3_i1.p1 TRINITY_DN12022_c1_g3~~TRINITY_DN12022_c1_g3_i1.p1  ORF type:complete len:446 (+),score=119.28 TRINITY_DN12022_c1_g3_i1:121-1458(+)
MAAVLISQARTEGIELKPAWVQQLVNTSDVHSFNDLFQRWLKTDLAETANVPSIPNFDDTKVDRLTQPLILQVNSVLDVGQSAYAQLEKAQSAARRQGVDTTVEEDRNDGFTQQQGQQVRSKLLKIKLSDGHGYIVGMEFKPIKELFATMTPGLKVRILPKTIVRRGVLLLQPSCIQILGGKVTNMIPTDGHLAVLKKCFGLDEDEEEDADQAQMQPNLVAIDNDDDDDAVLELEAHEASPDNDMDDNDDMDDSALLAALDQAEANLLDATAELPPKAPKIQHETSKPLVGIGSTARSTPQTGETDDMDDSDDDFDGIALSATRSTKLTLDQVAVSQEWFKGQIMEFIDNLKPRQEGWQLQVRLLLDDVTGLVPAMIVNDVLVQVIGMSSTEFRAARKHAKKDAVAKAALTKKLSNVNDALLAMSGHFRLQRTVDHELHVIQYNN